MGRRVKRASVRVVDVGKFMEAGGMEGVDELGFEGWENEQEEKGRGGVAILHTFIGICVCVSSLLRRRRISHCVFFLLFPQISYFTFFLRGLVSVCNLRFLRFFLW